MVLDVAAEVLEGAWRENDAERDKAIAAAIDKHATGEDHTRPRGLIVPSWTWTSGDTSTALVASATEPGGFVWIPMPQKINQIRTRGYPSGTATVVVKYVEPGQPLSAAVTLLTFSHSGETDGEDFVPPLDVPQQVDLVAFLTAVATIRVFSANVEERRT
jgi:hypothetical protein